MQVVDDGNVASAVATCRQDALRLVFLEDRPSRAKLLEERCPSIDPAPCLPLTGIRHLHERSVLAADFGRRLRAPAQVM